jgi:hypothetical protein
MEHQLYLLVFNYEELISKSKNCFEDITFTGGYATFFNTLKCCT